MGWERILSAAAPVESRNQVAYFDVPCRRVLNRGGGQRGASANPYLNCELGCVFCLARDFSQRREPGSAGGGEAFARRIYAKPQAPQVLAEELALLARRGRLGARTIALGTATDPYQPLERRRRLTRALLEQLVAVAEGSPQGSALRVTLSTRSDAVTADLALLARLARAAQLRVSVSLNALDRDLLRSLEPRAPTPARRLRALESLAAAGVPVGVSCTPILPELTDRPLDLRRVICAAQEAGARWFEAQVLVLRGASRASFLGWLARERPGLLGFYRRLYRGAAPPPAYLERIERVVDLLRRQYALPAGLPFQERAPAQLDLFSAAPRRLPLAS